MLLGLSEKNPAPVIDNQGLFPEGAQTQIKRAYEFSGGRAVPEKRPIIASAGVPEFLRLCATAQP